MEPVDRAFELAMYLRGYNSKRLTLAHLLLLLALAWPGPRPVGHTHEELAVGSDSAAVIAWHGQWLHHCEEGCDDSLLGWHVHWLWSPSMADGQLFDVPAPQVAPASELGDSSRVVVDCGFESANTLIGDLLVPAGGLSHVYDWSVIGSRAIVSCKAPAVLRC